MAFSSGVQGTELRCALVLQSTPHYLSLVKAMAPEGGIDDFEMTRRNNLRGRWQEIQKLSEVSQVRRLGNLADHRIQLKKNNPLSRSLLAVVRGASRVNACMGQGR